MKRIMSSILAMLISLSLFACGQSGSTWQEQYDLGVKYLSEGKYQEAIIAFTAAIEIDPKQAVIYSGRGQAYVLSGETEENLAAALADFEAALAVDENLVDAWLGLADVYIRQGDFDKALELLKEALSKTNENQSIADKLAEMERGIISDTSGKTRKSCYYENGELIQYWLYEYNKRGENVLTYCYNGDDTLNSTIKSEFDEQGREIRNVTTHDDGVVITETFEYDHQNRVIRETRTNTHTIETEGGEISTQNAYTYTLVSYDEQAGTETQTAYDEEGNLVNQFVIEYDKDGVRRKGSSYVPGENGELYLEYYVTYIWNEDGTYGGFEHFQVAEREETAY